MTSADWYLSNRPARFALHFWRVLIPYVVPYIPSSLGSQLASYVPHANLQKLQKIVRKMDEQSRQIYYEKKTAFEKGDKAVEQQIGEGKDIMSILSKEIVL
jgi:hypothetical protein